VLDGADLFTPAIIVIPEAMGPIEAMDFHVTLEPKWGAHPDVPQFIPRQFRRGEPLMWGAG